MMPPLITVGSSPPASSSAAIIDVVVVLPWVPATATVFCIRISSASISARLTRGRRSCGGGLHFRIAVLDRRRADDDRGIAEVVGRMADGHRNAGLAQFLDDIAFGHVRALHLVAEPVHDLGDARHADAADADEVDRADVGAQRLLMRGLPPAKSVRTRGVSSGAHQRRREAFADALDEIGEVARGVRAADRQSALGGIVERDRVGGHRLDLASEHVRA